MAHEPREITFLGRDDVDAYVERALEPVAV
jgi:hypothetical protein